MRICLVEDQGTSGLEPLTLTRSSAQLLMGQTTLGEKIFRAFGVGPGPARRGMVVRAYLEPLIQQSLPQVTVNNFDWIARGPLIIVRDRWVPPPQFRWTIEGSGWVGLCEGVPAFAQVSAEQAGALRQETVEDWFAELLSRRNVESAEVGGGWVNHPWDLVERNSQAILQDFQAAGPFDISNRHLAQLAVVGPVDRVRVHESARIDPYVVFDTTEGPITVGPSVWIQPFTRLEGPVAIGTGSQLFRAHVRAGVTIGPNCRIGGEVEGSIIQGHSNKYHEGFLGHSFVGEWVNMGAISSSSDLRNDYGEVSVPLHGKPVSTGQKKVGCYLGDYTRIGLGSLLNTGTVIGVMANVLPAGWLLPRHVPSFLSVRWGRLAPGYPLEDQFKTARTVKGRRGQEFSPVEEKLFETLYERTRLERERALERSQDRRGAEWPLSV